MRNKNIFLWIILLSLNSLIVFAQNISFFPLKRVRTNSGCLPPELYFTLKKGVNADTILVNDGSYSSLVYQDTIGLSAYLRFINKAGFVCNDKCETDTYELQTCVLPKNLFSPTKVAFGEKVRLQNVGRDVEIKLRRIRDKLVSDSLSYNVYISFYGDVDEINQMPIVFNLSQNYPNPFNPTTVISYQLSAFSHVTLKVYDLLGREVATLVDEYKQPGNYNSQFSILNYPLCSGIYFYRLRAGLFSETKKMILMK